MGTPALERILEQRANSLAGDRTGIVVRILDSDVSRVLAVTPPRPVATRGNVQRSIEVNRGGKVEQSLVN